MRDDGAAVPSAVEGLGVCAGTGTETETESVAVIHAGRGGRLGAGGRGASKRDGGKG